MLPALPTGVQWRSGARPSASQISNAHVFWPWSRNGFTEFTSVTGYRSARPLVRVSAASELPSTSRTRAPWMRVWASLPTATFPRGTSTAQVSPALPAYAAADALVFPVEAHTTAFEPSSTAFDIARVIPRSLNDPVGLAPSNFRKTSQPVSADSVSDRISGVPPSWRVTTGVASVTGRRERYSSITPRHGVAITGLPSFDLLHAEHAGHGVHRVQGLQLAHGGLEGALPGPVGDQHKLGEIGRASCRERV